nr:right-handed parallel beta-helix repeat-containing protein [Rhodopirellula sp. SM50]
MSEFRGQRELDRRVAFARDASTQGRPTLGSVIRFEVAASNQLSAPIQAYFDQTPDDQETLESLADFVGGQIVQTDGQTAIRTTIDLASSEPLTFDPTPLLASSGITIDPDQPLPAIQLALSGTFEFDFGIDTNYKSSVDQSFFIRPADISWTYGVSESNLGFVGDYGAVELSATGSVSSVANAHVQFPIDTEGNPETLRLADLREGNEVDSIGVVVTASAPLSASFNVTPTGTISGTQSLVGQIDVEGANLWATSFESELLGSAFADFDAFNRVPVVDLRSPLTQVSTWLQRAIESELGDLDAPWIAGVDFDTMIPVDSVFSTQVIEPLLQDREQPIATYQGFFSELSAALGVTPGELQPSYQKSTQRLSFRLPLGDVPVYENSFPFDSGVTLGPLTEFVGEGEVTVTSVVDHLGVSLAIDLSEHRTELIGQVDAPVDGVLGSDAVFTLALGLSQEEEVRVPRDPTNTSVADLVTDIQTAIAASGIEGLTVEAVDRRIRMTSSPAINAPVLVIAADPENASVTELGLASPPPPRAASLLGLEELPGDGILSGDANFRISIHSGPLQDITLTQLSTMDNTSRADLVEDLQFALDQAAVPVKVDLFQEVLLISTLDESADSRLTIMADGAGVAGLELGLSGTMVSQPNLALGVDVSSPDERIRVGSVDWDATTTLSMSDWVGQGIAGIVEIDVADGSASGSVHSGFAYSPSTSQSLGELYTALDSGEMPWTATASGSGTITLPIAVSGDVFTLSGNAPQIQVTDSDLISDDDAVATWIDASEVERLSSLTMDVLLAGLRDAGHFLQAADQSDALDSRLPFTPTSIDGLVSLAPDFLAGVDQIAATDKVSLQGLRQDIADGLGLTIDQVAWNLIGGNDLRITIDTGQQARTRNLPLLLPLDSYQLGVDVPAAHLDGVTGLRGDASFLLPVDVTTSADLVFGFDLAVAGATTYVHEDSTAAVGLRLAQNGVSFDALVGPLNVEVVGGSLHLDDGQGGEAGVAFSLPTVVGGKWDASQILAATVTSVVTGRATADLPIAYPAGQTPLAEHLNVTIDPLTGGGTIGTSPDLGSLLASIDPTADVSGLPDSFRSLFGDLQTAASATTLAARLPLIGDSLVDLTFLSDLGEEIAAEIETDFLAGDLSDAVAQAAVERYVSSLESGGSAPVGSESSSPEEMPDGNCPPNPPAGTLFCRDIFALLPPIFSFTKSVPLNSLGIPGFTADPPANVTLSYKVAFDMRVGYTVDQRTWIYTEDPNEIEIRLLGLSDFPSEITGWMGGMLVNLNDTGTDLTGTIQIDLDEPSGDGYLVDGEFNLPASIVDPDPRETVNNLQSEIANDPTVLNDFGIVGGANVNVVPTTMFDFEAIYYRSPLEFIPDPGGIPFEKSTIAGSLDVVWSNQSYATQSVPSVQNIAVDINGTHSTIRFENLTLGAESLITQFVQPELDAISEFADALRNPQSAFEEPIFAADTPENDILRKLFGNTTLFDVFPLEVKENVSDFRKMIEAVERVAYAGELAAVRIPLGGFEFKTNRYDPLHPSDEACPAENPACNDLEEVDIDLIGDSTDVTDDFEDAAGSYAIQLSNLRAEGATLTLDVLRNQAGFGKLFLGRPVEMVRFDAPRYDVTATINRSRFFEFSELMPVVAGSLLSLVPVSGGLGVVGLIAGELASRTSGEVRFFVDVTAGFHSVKGPFISAKKNETKLDVDAEVTFDIASHKIGIPFINLVQERVPKTKNKWIDGVLKKVTEYVYEWVEVEASLAGEIGVRGGLRYEATARLKDADRDGRVFIDDYPEGKLACAADLHIRDYTIIDGFYNFGRFGSGKVHLLKHPETIWLSSQIKDQLQIDCEGVIDPPILGEIGSDGTLYLNMGPRAAMRLVGNVIDGNEAFEVQVFEQGYAIVSAFGINQVIGDGTIPITGVYAHGGAGNDSIVIKGPYAVPATIFGGDGNDTITGYTLADQLSGNDGNDVINGGEGNDTIQGGSGHDKIQAGTGDDSIVGGTGNDTISGSHGDDRIQGEDGADELHGNNGKDTIHGGAGFDQIWGGSGNDLLSGGATMDFLYGEAGNDELWGDAGDDQIFAGIGDDTVYGGSGRDVLAGHTGDDWIYGHLNLPASGDETDWILAGGGKDHVFGEGGDDTISLVSGLNTAYGGAGEDTFFGGTDRDVIYGEAGPDFVYAGAGNDLIEGGPGDDVLWGESGADEIHGGSGRDYVSGGSSNDLIVGGLGTDTIRGGSGADQIYGHGDDTTADDASADSLFGDSGPDQLFGNDGDDRLAGGADADRLEGGAGDDTILGDSGNDWMFGNQGEDTLFGGLGNDIASGGEGNDQVDGEEGDDTLYGDAGDDVVAGQLGDDILDGGRGVDLLTGGVGSDLIYAGAGIGNVVHGDEGADRIYGSADGSDDPDHSDAVYFGDLLYGGTGDDSIFGSGGADRIDGGAGRDSLHGGSHGDFILGGLGDDQIHAGAGSNNQLFGDEGNDTLTGSSLGDDLIYGGAGQDQLFGRGGDDLLSGQAGDDHLDGGVGTDSLFGGQGRDVLYAGGGNRDRLEGGDDPDVLHGSDDGADLLFGQAGRDVIYAYGGNDEVDGGADDDQIDGGAGDDLLFGGAGIDIIVGGADHDRIYGHRINASDDDSAVDYLYGDFADPNRPNTGGNDQLFGQGGNDLHFGEGGDDFINPGTSSGDTIDYGSGESANPADFQPPSSTPDPTPGAAAPESFSLAMLPVAPDVAGRWNELSGSASAHGLSGQGSWNIDPAVVTGDSASYVAWTKLAPDSSHIGVAKWDGTQWSEIGGSLTGRGVDQSVQASQSPTLAIDSQARPLVAWTQTDGGDTDIYLRQYNTASDGWEALGDSDNEGGVSGTGQARDPMLVMTDDGPVALWIDDSSGNSQIYARGFSQGAWQEIGSDSATGGGISQSANDVLSFDVAVDGNRVAVSWLSLSAGQIELTAAEFDGAGWNTIGSAIVAGPAIPTDEIGKPSIVYHQGLIYLAWTQITSNMRSVAAARLVGVSWQTIEIVNVDGNALAPNHGHTPQLASDGQALALTWQRDQLPLERSSAPIQSSIDVTTFNGSRFAETFPGEASGRGAVVSRGQISGYHMALDSDGRPIVSWTNRESGRSPIFVRQGPEPITGAVYRTSSSGTVAQILANHSLGPGDAIVIEHNQPGFTVGSDDSGVLILNRNQAVIGGNVIVRDASDIMLQGLSVTGSVSLESAQRVTVRDSSLWDLDVAGGESISLTGNHLRSLSLSGAAAGALIRDNAIETSISIESGGVTDVLVEHNRAGTIHIASVAAGEIRENQIQTLVINESFQGRVHHNEISGSDVGVTYAAPTILEANRIYGHRVGVVATVDGQDAALGFVAGTTLPNVIYDNETGVDLTGRMQLQSVHDNDVGVTGSGQLGGASLDQANTIHSNVLGVDFDGPVLNNRITQNVTGLIARSDQQISRNVFARNSDVAIVANNTDRTRVIHNTFYATDGDGVRTTNSSSHLEIRSNLFATVSGTNLSFDHVSQAGLVSDFNLLHAGSSGVLVHWSEDFTDLLDWQADLARYDLNSRGTTRIHPSWSDPQFVSAATDDFGLHSPIAGQRFGNLPVLAADPIDDIAFVDDASNLLINPGFESGLANWIVNDGASSVTDPAFAFSGDHYFAPGDTAVARAEQVIDLASQGMDVAVLDSGILDVKFGGRIRTSASSPDEGAIQLEVLNADGDVLTSRQLNATTISQDWLRIADSFPLHVDARSIRYWFQATTVTGSSNDAFLDHTFVRLENRDERRHIGAVQPTNSREAYSAVPAIQLLSSDLYTDWLRSDIREIRWNTTGNEDNAFVRIDLLQDNVDGPTHLLTLTESTVDDGVFAWSPEAANIDAGTHGLRIQVSLVDSPIVFDRSSEGFSVPENTTTYYVNDNSSLGDEYTSAAGDNRNTGRTPDAPKPNPANVMRTYALRPGQTLFNDTGDYLLQTPVEIAGGVSQGNDEGFSWVGPLAETADATFDFVNPTRLDSLIQLNDADFVTISGLDLVDAGRGIWAGGGTTNFVGSDLLLTGHRHEGLRFESGSSATRLEDIVAIDNGADGIFVGSGVGSLENVTARDNDGNGLTVAGIVSATDLTVLDNRGYGIYASSYIRDLADSVISGNSSDGIWTREMSGVFSDLVVQGNDGYGLYALRAETATIQASEFRNNTRDGIQIRSTLQGTTTIGNEDLSSGLGNVVAGNGGNGVVAGGMVIVVGNKITGHRTTGTYGLRLGDGGIGKQNVVTDNDRGVYLDGVGGSELWHNRIYNNTTYGIVGLGGSRITGNIVYSNQYGIDLDQSGLEIENNLVYDNPGGGLRIHRSYNALAKNNTIFQPVGNAVSLYSNSKDLTFQNNIVVVGSGAALSIASNSQEGFSSDFNLYEVTDGGRVGNWQGVRETLARWRSATGQDRNSIEQDPLFVNPTGPDGLLGYVDESNDGRDDDFHLQSLHGRSTGSETPVLDSLTGLPVLVDAAVVQDTQQSPAIDRGNAGSDFTGEPVPNGGFINLGAFGNTTYASLSPTEYVLVTRPNGGEAIPAGREFAIRWRSHNELGNVTIELTRDDDPGVTVLATDLANSGEFLWSIPADITPSDQYRIRVVREGQEIDSSDHAFAITEPISAYYVNISGDVDFSDNQYTSAAGDDTNDGLTPSSPMATIQALLNTYDLGSGDTIFVDSGEYTLTTNLKLSSVDSGIVIQGPTDADKVAVLDRNNINPGNYAIEFTGGDNITLRNLELTGGRRGIYSGWSSSYSNRLESVSVHGNASEGIYFDRNNSFEIHQSVISDNGRDGVYVAGGSITLVGNQISKNGRYGIYLVTNGAVVRDNVVGANYSAGMAIGSYGGSSTWVENLVEGNRVTGNLGDGIVASYRTLVTGNSISGHHQRANGSAGIKLDDGATARNNEVFDNEIGIHASHSSSLVEENRIYSNDYIGIYSDGSQVRSNVVYDCYIGVYPRGWSTVSGNTIYDSYLSIYALQASNSVVDGNTVYAPDGFGFYQRQAQNITLTNNILASSRGIYFRSDAQVDLNHDYNLFYGIDGGPIAGWQGYGYFDSLVDYSLEIGQDRNSNEGDPRFVDPDGQDGILGWDASDVGDAISIDDGDVGFSTTGTWEVYNAHTGGDQLRTSEAGTATWTFTDLEPGYYKVLRNYRNLDGSYSPLSVYTIGDPATGSYSLAYSSFGGRQTITDEWLANVEVFSGTLEVTLEYSEYYAIADTITIQRMVGDGGADDNFHVFPGSPAIDSGRLESFYGQEPLPNGGRRNLGAYGNTPEATPSPSEVVQVLSPNGLEKLEIGNTVEVSWRYDGVPFVGNRSDDYSAAILASSPVGYWRLSEASDTSVAADVMGDHPGTYVGSVARQQPDVFEDNAAIGLDGSGYVEVPDNVAFDSDQLTFEAWVEIGDLDSGNHTILSKGGHRIYRQGDLLRAYVSNTGSSSDVYRTLPASGGWIHVAATYDGSVLRLYIDGEYVHGRTLNGDLRDSTYPLRVGANRSGSERWTDGVDEVAFYDRALSADEIAAHYAAGLSKSPVRVELVEESTGATVATLGEGQLGRSLDWTIPDTVVADTEYRLRVTNELGAQASDLSDQSFVIGNGGTSFYVNLADDADLTDNQYTTAAGDNRASGKRPDQPLSSIKAVLDRYDLEPGDTIYVDTGSYQLATNIAISGNDSGVTIQGPTDADKVAVLDRNNINPGNYAIEFTGGDNITLRNLELTGGRRGIYSGWSSSYSNRLESVSVHGNASEGIYFDRNNSFEIHQSVISDNGRDGVYVAGGSITLVGNQISKNGRYGIYLVTNGAVVRDNVVGANYSAGMAIGSYGGSSTWVENLVEGNRVTGNLGDGIVASYRTLVTGNSISGHHQRANGSAGIKLDDGATARNNEVFDNEIGIHASHSSSLVEENRIYSNDYIGIYSDGSQVRSNVVYDCYIGVYPRGWSTVSGNTIYDSYLSIYALQASNSVVDGNTVYAPDGFGFYQRQAQNITLTNNILASSRGIYFRSDAQVDLNHDYNLFYGIDGGPIAGWQGYGYFDSLVDYSLEIGQDRNSNEGDPRFVDPDGQDGILGWDASDVGDAISIDDGDVGFSTTGTWEVYNAHTGGDQLRTSEAGTATWTFTDLEPGYYKVLRNYRNLDGSYSPLSVYTIGDPATGSYSLAYSSFGGRQTITDEWLANVEVFSGTLEVTLEYSEYYAIADTITIQRMVGDGGADDNFHVFPGSPAIDSGRLESFYGQEPLPNGGRRNLGAYGNTPEATPSPSEVVQVLSPNGLEKLEIGNTVEVSWRYDGVPFVGNRSDDYSAAILASSPVGYWRLSEASDTSVAADVMGDHPGTYVGSVARQQPDVFEDNAAIGLDGSGYVEVPDNVAFDSDQLTFEAWVEIGDLDSGNHTILSKGGHRIYRQGDLLRAYVSNTGSSSDVYRTLPASGGWIHVAATYDGSVLRLYIDGEYVHGRTLNGDLRDSTYPLRVGANRSGSERWTDGVDEVAFYDRALSADEIAAHYAAGLSKSPVRVELVEESTGATVATLGEGQLGRSLDWTIPDTVVADTEYRLRVTNELGAQASDLSDQSFVIGNGGTSFYVNLADDADLTDNQYTTAAGDNRASGKRPDQPLSSIKAVLDRYDLEPGDTIYVDTGSYQLATNIVISGNDSGVTIQGPTDADKVAVLDRANTDSTSAVFELLGADRVTIKNFGITGAYHGVLIPNGRSSDQVRLMNNHIFSNQHAGVFLGNRSTNSMIQENRIHDTGTYGIFGTHLGHQVVENEVYANTNGIYFGHGGRIAENVVYGNLDTGIRINGTTASPGIVERNIVYQNTKYGIESIGVDKIIANEVFDHPDSSSGISLQQGEAYDNVVYDNYYGIYLERGRVEHNRVFSNYVGINAVSGTVDQTKINANQIYSNSTAIWVRGSLSVNTGDADVTNNLVYANTNTGVYFLNARNSRFVNNTVYHPVGTAVAFARESSNFEVVNNIIIVEAGTGLSLSSDISNFTIDYNLYHVQAGANLGAFNGAHGTLADWQTATGQEGNSIIGDPEFVDIDGADNLLGVSEAGVDGGVDDNFFRLSGSLAIDRGDSWAAPREDITGNSRSNDPGVANAGSNDYARIDLVADPPVVSGDPQTWRSDRASWTLTLPFVFPFYGTSYTTVQVSSDGFLHFAGSDPRYGAPSEGVLYRNRRIAVLWDDFTTATEGKDIYVDESQSGKVTIRWDATSRATGGDVSFSVTLHETGNVRFDYLSGDLASLNSLVGISAGDGRNYQTFDSSEFGGGELPEPIELGLSPGFVDLGAYEFRGDSRDVTAPQIIGSNPLEVDSQSLVVDPMGSLTLQLSEPINEIDANSTAAYELVFFGVDGSFGTADDQAILVIPDYVSGASELTLSFEETLQPGKYRLSVLGSATVHDLAGNRLDGAGAGQAGTDYVRDFSVFQNNKPIADDIQVTTNEDTSVRLTLTGDDGDALVDQDLAFILVSLPARGELSISETGNAILATELPLTLTSPVLHFRPDEHFNGSVSFQVQVFDGYGSVPDAGNTSQPGVVTVDVAAVPDPPNADDLLLSIPENIVASEIASIPYSDPDLADLIPDTHVFRILSGNADNSFAIDQNGKLSVTAGHQLDYESASFRQLTVEVADASGLADISTVKVQILNRMEPEVEDVLINGGNAFRSNIDEVTVRFNQLVELDLSQGDAFHLRNTVTNQTVETVATVNNVDNKTVVNLTFLPGDSVDAAGSLADGRYELIVSAQRVSLGSFSLDGNADGSVGDNYVFGASEADSFFRFFGDSDGDGDVDGQDYGRFGLTFLKSEGDPDFNPAMDFDGDGDVDGQDYGQFGLRFLRTI